MQKIYKWNSLKQPVNVSIPESLLVSPPSDFKVLSADTQGDIQQPKNLQLALNKKFQQFIENSQFKNITKIFYNQRGRNHPINYEDKYHFKQQWEFSDKKFYKLHYNYLFPGGTLYQTINLILLVLGVFLVWILSIFRLFKNPQNNWIFNYCLIYHLLDLAAKIFFIKKFQHTQTIKPQNKRITLQKLFKIFIGNLYCLIYSALGSLSVSSDVNCKQLLVLDILAIAVCYIRCEAIYQNSKKKKYLNPKFKSYLNIFDLMSNLFLIIHIFAILVYSISQLQESNPNYLSQIRHVSPQTWIQKYLYSIYFSTTTMLTVGYGDITPVNYAQIVMVLVMQVFGIVTIGYINGQVGDILCKLRTQRQIFQHDLQNLSKISKSYNLSHQVRQKIQDYLVSNKKTNKKSIIQQEGNLLAKVNTQLKEQANNSNQINVVKRSLFFILNFSKKSQIQMSYKLQKLILPPDESLPQIIGKQKLYILKQGEISFYISRRFKNWDRKIISKITKNQQQIYKNTYGQVSTILGRTTRLKAFSGTFSICYTLSRTDLIECIQRDIKDFEHFHVIRAKLQQMQHPQKGQNSLFYNHKDHYEPNLQLLLKNQKRQNTKDKRKEFIRSQGRKKLHWQSLHDEDVVKSVNSVPSSQNSDLSQDSDQFTQTQMLNVLTEKQRQLKYKSIDKNVNLIANLKSRTYQKRVMNKAYIKKKEQLIQGWGINKLKDQKFQSMKQFQYFFNHSNPERVLKKINFKNNINGLITHYIDTLQNQSVFNTSSKTLNSKDKFFKSRKALKSGIV